MKDRHILFQLLGLYFSVFLFCAIMLQIRAGGLSTTSRAPAIDFFSGGLLWTASFVALLIAAARKDDLRKLMMWLAVSAIGAALAIDEVFEFHEKSKHAIGDDDYIKLLIWVCAGIGISVVRRLEKPKPSVMIFFVCGYLIQTLYLIIDVGDGDFYVSPLPTVVAIWAEEILELLFVQCYLVGLTVHHLDAQGYSDS